MTVLEAINEHLHAANTSKRRICWYIALVRTSDSSARDTDGDDFRTAGIWMDGDDDFSMSNPMDDLPFRLRQIASYPKAGSALRGCEAFV